jgi:hypothetical protein
VFIRVHSGYPPTGGDAKVCLPVLLTSMPIANLPKGLPKNVPVEFLKRLGHAEKPAGDAGATLSPTEVTHVLEGLVGADAKVKQAAAAWLLKNSAEFGRFTLQNKDARDAIAIFVAKQGDEIERGSSPLSTRIGRGDGRPVKLDDATKSAVRDGLALAVRRDEVSFRMLLKPPAPDGYFTPPVAMKLDAGDGERSYAVYVSKQVGIDTESTMVSDPKKAEKFLLFDVATSKATSTINLVRPSTGSAIPGQGMRQPGEEMPTLGAALPSVVQDALRDHLARAIRADEADWRASVRQPTASTHFMPGFKMRVHGPDDDFIEVQVLFSKSPDPSFAAPPTKAEEAKKVTLRDPASGKSIDYSFGMPGRVTLPVIGGG